MYYQNKSDETLVMLTLAGEQSAYEFLVVRYQKLVVASAITVTKNRFIAEDAAQDAFVTAWIKLNTLQEPKKYGSWVCRIAKNCALNMISRYCRCQHKNQSDFTQTAFTVNTSKQVDMCISDTFVYGGKKHISYSNLTGSGFSFYVFTKQGGKLTDVEVIHRPAGNGTVEISIDGDVEVMAVNSAFAPIMDKCAA